MNPRAKGQRTFATQQVQATWEEAAEQIQASMIEDGYTTKEARKQMRPGYDELWDGLITWQREKGEK